jgi:hypothetical protein
MVKASEYLRRHLLATVVFALGITSFAVFSWAEFGYFCDQAKSHDEQCSSFWSSEHIHDWVYNAFSNYQSELLFGILIVVMLHKLAGRKDEDET